MANRRLRHYEVFERIGAGGMATVYRGRDTRTGTIVAIKVMHTHLAENQQYIERFQREARTTMSVDSPHVVRILDLGQENSTYFLVMEYVSGITVQQLIQERGALPLSQALDIAAQVADGLEAAHLHNIVHRDIKPQNMMITPDGVVKVMDFGIARAAEMTTMTQTGLFMGSPHYASPEQAEGKRVDIRSDIYALGITLYQMLTGIVPFNADTPWAVMRQHLEGVPTAVRQLRVDVPPEVEALVMRALAKDPARRFQTPAEMSVALRAIQAPSSAVLQELATIVAPFVSASSGAKPVTSTSSRPASKRTLLMVSAAVALVVFGGLAAWQFSKTPALEPTPTSLAMEMTSGPSRQIALVADSQSAPTGTVRVPAADVPTVTPGATTTSAPTPVASSGDETSTPLPSDTPQASQTPVPTPRQRASTPTAKVTVASTSPELHRETLPAPVSLGPDDGWGEVSDAVTLEWSGVAQASGYQVETRSDRAGQTEWRVWGPLAPNATRLIIRYEDHPDYFAIPGTVYTWRIAALDGAGRPGDYAGSRRFVFNRRGEKATATQRLPTDTPRPATDTPKPPTDTPKPPTNTPKPPTDTPKPPTNTPGPSPYP